MINSLTKPDIVTIVQNEGVHLRPKGKSYFALCPFHAERVASFQVRPYQQRFKCYGCGETGDVISFIQKYHNLDFKEACKYLGISFKPDLKEIKKQQLVKTFREWCNDYYDDLCSLYRALQKAKEQAKTIEEIEMLAEFYHKESLWLYQIEILQSDDDQAKFELYKEVIYGN